MILVLLFELLLYYLSSYTILENAYGYVPRHKKIMCILPIVYFIFYIVDILIKTNIYPLILLALIIVNISLLKYIFSDARIRSIICILILLYSINISLSSIIIFVLNKSSTLLLKQLIGLIINSFIMISCMVICKLKQSYLHSKFQLIPLSVKRITILSLISSAFVISLVSDYSMVHDIDKWEISIRITIVLLIIIVGSAFPIMIANSIGKAFYTEQSKNFEHQIETQAKHYESLSKSNYELKRFKHDYKNMRIGIKKYIKDGNIKKAEEMIDSCDLSLNQATYSLIKFDTGNGIVDAILTEKQEKAATVDTVITFDGAVAASAIAATDLCVIFGNTLDNAIEACEKLQTDKQKIIAVVCKCSNGFMFLTITNPIAENVAIHNNTIKTSKQDKTNHGFGLYSLHKAIDKYDGTLNISCDNCLFKCEVVLNT